ncbi:MAG: SGNH/GDSL hydrolase family protein [Pseudomonadota bacterium]
MTGNTKTSMCVKSLRRLLQITVMALCVSISAHGASPTVIALFGDSISYGYINSSNPGGRVGNGVLNLGLPSTLLSDLLNSSGRESQVANLGYGGSPSGPSFNNNVGVGNGVDRINSDLDFVKNTYPGKAYYVLIMYGTNDHGYGISPSTTQFNYKLMIDRALAKGVNVVASTVPPCTGICSKSPSELIAVNNNIRSAISSRMTPGKNVYMVDNNVELAPNWGSWTVDGIHPNPTGYGIIAQNWFDNALKNLINPNISMSIVINYLLDDETEPPPEP